MKRRIIGLRWSRQLADRPRCIPSGRPRGQKALGVRYEKALAKAIPLAEHGVWFEYEDLNGHGYCQVDFLRYNAPTDELIVLECKHTWNMEAHAELERLYIPVVEGVVNRPVRGFVVCKNLTRECPKNWIVEDWNEIGRVVHWIGVGPLFSPTVKNHTSVSVQSLGF